MGAAFRIAQVGSVEIIPLLPREHGIGAARTVFPRVWFNEAGCQDGLKALRRYQRKVQADEKSLQRNPAHDWTSHYADAFRGLAVFYQGMEGPRNSGARQVRQVSMGAWT